MINPEKDLYCVYYDGDLLGEYDYEIINQVVRTLGFKLEEDCTSVQDTE